MFRRKFDFQNDKTERVSNEIGYSTKVYNLTSGVPISLPPGRDFMVIAADGDPDGLSVSVGDEVADFGRWPPGLTLKFDKPTKIRLLSNRSQTVTLNISRGTLALDDNSPDVYPMGNVQVYTFSGVGIVTSIAIAEAANLNGYILYQCNMVVRPTAGADGFGVVTAKKGGGTDSVLHASFASADPGLAPIPTQLAAPWRVGPGYSLRFDSTIAGASFSVACLAKLL